MSTLTQILVATIISIVNSFSNADPVSEIGQLDTGIECVDRVEKENTFYFDHLQSL